MASSHFFRLGKISNKKGKDVIQNALAHNMRTMPSQPHIDKSKSHLNYVLAGGGTPATIARHAKAQMVTAGIDKPRKNGVMAVEVIYSLPIDRHSQNTRPFFLDCLDWTKKTFAGELLSFVVHLDESAPHAHALILPLINGRMQGSDMVGGKGNLYRLINLFHLEVGNRYGLSKNKKGRLTSKDKAFMERYVLAIYEARNDPSMQSTGWSQIRDAIHQDPLPFFQALSSAQPESITNEIITLPLAPHSIQPSTVH